MDKNTAIGIVLIVLCFWAYLELNKPSQAQLDRQQAMRDSIELAQQQELQNEIVAEETTPTTADSVKQYAPAEPVIDNRYGIFSPVMSGTEEVFTMKNDLFSVEVGSKGGRIREVELQDYYKFLDKKGKTKELLKLMNAEDNSFGFTLPMPNGQEISTNEIFFQPVDISNAKATLRATISEGRYIEKTYQIEPGKYNIEYNIRFVGLNDVLDFSDQQIVLRWTNHQDQLEINRQFDKLYTAINYCDLEGDVDFLGRQKTKTVDRSDESVKWISYTNQFFNSTLIGQQPFDGAVMHAEQLPETDAHLKVLTSSMALPYRNSREETLSFDWFIGPNDFEILSDYNNQLQEIIPFGQSVFGTINRWVIRPIFNFLQQFIGSKGIVILLLTFIVKAAVYPLTYRMLYSQSKMGALKPQMAKMREKYKDEPQKVQMESMKVYREYGVNPAGGCMPMLLQMPIWFALYRFFPASIDFRQASFLWANDLSSYDVAFWLPTNVPFLGDHISLFTLLWAVSILLYTYYNNKIMDMSSINPAMKYMQYLMPLMFIFFFNNYASGLTCYLLFANIINISQTLITKNYIIDQEKIKAELEANKKKPKKKGGFQQRLEQAMKEQQRVAAEREKAKKSRR